MAQVKHIFTSLKLGCPNKCDMATLSQYSIRLTLRELYDKIYGNGTYEKYVEKNVMKKIEASQKAWKENGGK